MSKTPVEKFFDLVKMGKSDECWIWVGSKTENGYGHLTRDDRIILAHRYSWIIHNGPIPDGLHVLHTCDNRACINPNHLWLGTRKDNQQDMNRKGRGLKGKKLSEEHKAKMRASHQLNMIEGNTVKDRRNNEQKSHPK